MKNDKLKSFGMKIGGNVKTFGNKIGSKVEQVGNTLAKQEGAFNTAFDKFADAGSIILPSLAGLAVGTGVGSGLAPALLGANTALQKGQDAYERNRTSALQGARDLKNNYLDEKKNLKNSYLDGKNSTLRIGDRVITQAKENNGIQRQ